MSENERSTNDPLDSNALETKKRMEELARAIRDEMGSMTQEELERLYAAIALMQLKQDE